MGDDERAKQFVSMPVALSEKQNVQADDKTVNEAREYSQQLVQGNTRITMNSTELTENRQDPEKSNSFDP